MKKLLLLLSFVFILEIYAEDKSLFSFGLIADCQYCDKPSKGKRHYRDSVKKLQSCVDELNKYPLSYVVHLGDFINKDFKSFSVVGPIYKKLKMPAYHVLGNHDYSVKDELKKDVPKTLGMESTYYDFTVKDWRFIVLDGNDVSFHSHPKGSEGYKFAEQYYEENKIKSPKWNGAIGKKQLSWVKERLELAKTNNQSVVLYCHFPVYPRNKHNLWNDQEVVALLESYACVKAYINGHNHGGNYAVKKGIHYLTIKGMVDTKETAFAIANISSEQIVIKGFGRESDRVLKLNK